MGAMFRSEKMALCQLFIQPEAAYPSVSELGETGCVQFRDLNANVNAFQRKFVNEVRRCDEMERKLRYIETELRKDEVKIPDLMDDLPRAPNPREIINLEAQLEKAENEIIELSDNAVNLKSDFLELTELKYVLEKTHIFLAEQEGSNGSDTLTRNLNSEDTTGNTAMQGRLGFVAGVVPRERVPGFERMLWRISRGNVFLRQAELEDSFEDPTTGKEIFKTVFVAFFQGEQLKSRVKKVCTGFHASLYPCPTTKIERQDMLMGVRNRLQDLNTVLDQTIDHRQRVLKGVAKELQNWMVMVRKMKAIYHTLNMFNMDVTKKCLIGECWVPVGDLELVRQCLDDGGKACGSSVPSFLNVIETPEMPPTFNRTNKFTRGFQVLIDSYGVASYREVNPALYTIITFPFLFAIMFGDGGHGVIVTIFSLYMVLWEEKLSKQKSKSEIWNILFAGRYIILLMGLFSIYTGIIYNDFFSKSFNVFGTSWLMYIENDTLPNSNDTLANTSFILLDPKTNVYAGNPYPVGVDPVWQLAPKNKIVFLNTYKMKLSIIFGVAHMIFGVCVGVVNHVHFKNYSFIILEFVPRILFLVLLFGYMVALIFIKWIIYGPKNEKATSPVCAPHVLITFINMMLFNDAKMDEGCSQYMFESQMIVQKIFLFVALLCIPVLLLGQPLYLIISGRRHKARTTTGNEDMNEELDLQPEIVETYPESKPAKEEHEENELMEIFIHQAIHTIEYVLNTVSHTASYLRLWALSLAHAQLSDVLWTMVLRMGLVRESYVGAVMLYIVFAFWAACTLAILILMEGLSAFLHTLRLHWVEFMSKFYTGTGYIFQPFSFKSIFEEENEEE